MLASKNMNATRACSRHRATLEFQIHREWVCILTQGGNIRGEDRRGRANGVYMKNDAAGKKPPTYINVTRWL
jgi:hypothetical protein